MFRKFGKKLFGKKTPRDFLLNIMPKESICAEVGVHLGDFSEKILSIVKPKKLHLIDPWKYEDTTKYQGSWYGGKKGQNQNNMDNRYKKILERFDSKIKSQQVTIHRSESSVLKEFNDNYFDWVYIDGNHLYEFVKNDLNWSLPKVKTNGYITGDDYSTKGWWDDGITRAVDELVYKGSVKLIEIKNNQFVLKKK